MVRAAHRSTIEITREEHLTPSGDCIVGVRADKGLADLSSSTKRALKSNDARVKLRMVTPGGEFSIWARGSDDLSFESRTALVIRRSSYVCGRTLAILAESSAREVPRAIVGSLKSSGAAGVLRIEVHA